LAAFLIRIVAGGVFITNVKLLSANAVITTGIGRPGSTPWVWALNALQNSMMFRPRWPSAGPIGGEGFALPAGTCSLMKPTIFLAIQRLPECKRRFGQTLLRLLAVAARPLTRIGSGRRRRQENPDLLASAAR
jgi:hypothetical protein